MELEQVAEMLESAGLIGEIIRVKVSDFRFIEISSRAADASGEHDCARRAAVFCLLGRDPVHFGH